MLVGVGAFGLLVGAVTGFIGAGGAIIAVPALVYVIGIPVETAVSTSLVMGAISPVAALIPRVRKRTVEWRTAAAVAAAGIPAAFAGTAVSALSPERVLMLTFAVLMVLAGVQMLRPRPERVELGPRPRWWVARALIVGSVVGFLTGLLGVGGGFITVPALVFALDLPIAMAIGTSLAIALVNSLAGVVAHAQTTHPDWRIAIAFAIPAVITSFSTAHLAHRVSGKLLQRSFAILIFVVAAITALQVLLS